jgi:2-oxoacid:acceptor oxidoreductase delta subunit (pyruvate/2-ketoisovalerate family)
MLPKSKSSFSNKTGSWRTFRPAIDNDKCIGCQLCVKLCPEGCIKMADSKAVIDFDYCKGCGLCADQCPMKAIDMKK